MSLSNGREVLIMRLSMDLQLDPTTVSVDPHNRIHFPIWKVNDGGSRDDVLRSNGMIVLYSVHWYFHGLCSM